MRRSLVAVVGLLLLVGGANAGDHVQVSSAKATLYSRPAAESFALLALEKGAEMELLENVGDWCSVKVLRSTVKGAIGVKGYVSRSDVAAVASRAEEAKPAAKPAPAPTPPPAPRTAPPPVVRAPAPVPPSAPAPTPVAPAPRASVPPPPPPSTPHAPARTRLVFLLSGIVAPTKLDFSETRTFTDFAEPGSLDVAYEYKTGFGGEAGLRYFFTEHVGAEAIFSYVQRNGTATFTGRFPHPLYLGRPRAATGTVSSLSEKETTVHVDLVYGGGQGSLHYAVFAGASFFFKVQTDLIDLPRYAHSYPYDSITITDVPVLSEGPNVVGFNVGGEVEHRFTDRVGAALSARYSRASVELSPDANNKVKLDAGGLVVGLGIRVRF